jgi:hypothetical protein
MNIKEELLKEHSKAQTMRIVAFVGVDKKRFQELMQLFLNNEYRITQRAAWSVSYCAIAHPALIKPYMSELIAKLKEPNVHDAVKRNIVRIWEAIDIPDDNSGEIYDICFGYLRSLDEPIAVKAFSMTVLGKICRNYLELKEELKASIEDMMPFGSPAIVSRGKKLLKELQKM